MVVAVSESERGRVREGGNWWCFGGGWVEWGGGEWVDGSGCERE